MLGRFKGGSLVEAHLAKTGRRCVLKIPDKVNCLSDHQEAAFLFGLKGMRLTLGVIFTHGDQEKVAAACKQLRHLHKFSVSPCVRRADLQIYSCLSPGV